MTPTAPPNDNVAHALAGAGGGILSMVLTYPLLTLSTRAQVESRRAESAFLSAAQNIVAREGISGLYSGLNSALLGISVTNFVYYYWYEWTKAWFESRGSAAHRKLTTVEAMMAGALAGSATVIMTNPIWVINTRMATKRQIQQQAHPRIDTAEPPRDVEQQAGAADKKEIKSACETSTDEQQQQRGPSPATAPAPATATAPAPAPAPTLEPIATKPEPPSGTIGTLLALIRHEGPQALFAGVLPALVLVANPILQYTLFEQLKNRVERRRKVTPAVAFFLGALGKLFATTITYPYITVKSQMHVAGRGRNQEGMLAAIRRLVREEGCVGLYKGLGPKVAQSVLTAALLFAFKDVLYERIARIRMAGVAKTRPR